MGLVGGTAPFQSAQKFVTGDLNVRKGETLCLSLGSAAWTCKLACSHTGGPRSFMAWQQALGPQPAQRSPHMASHSGWQQLHTSHVGNGSGQLAASAAGANSRKKPEAQRGWGKKLRYLDDCSGAICSFPKVGIFLWEKELQV